MPNHRASGGKAPYRPPNASKYAAKPPVEESSDQESDNDIPSKRPQTGGKFVPGYTPTKGFTAANNDDSDDEMNDAGAADDDDFDGDDTLPVATRDDDLDADYKIESGLEEEDDEADGTYGVSTAVTPGRAGAASATPKSGKTGRVNAVSKGKMTDKKEYKKKPRRDACRFTTTQAMIDAEEELHPKVAALVGKKIIGKGNGRQGGRQLIRWNTATDQLLLLCLHHELAMIKDDLPYEQIAARMFPEKCATGGAIKERFAKLRIECLNRGSWVPPIIGKTPQGQRPNVRGVVRLAPGHDRGRYVLWKEDASKLIDPKDIMKGFSDCQAQGLEFPPRRWIAESSKEEFYRLKAEMEARGLVPNGAVPVDDDEEEEDEDVEEDDEEDEEENEALIDEHPFRIPDKVTPASKKGKTPAKTPKTKETPASKKRKTPQDAVSETPAKRQSTGKSGGKRAVSPIIKDEVMSTPTPVPRSVRPKRGAAAKHSGKAPGTGPSRKILVFRGFPPQVLAPFPAGKSGKGSVDYFEDEVTLIHFLSKYSDGEPAPIPQMGDAAAPLDQVVAPTAPPMATLNNEIATGMPGGGFNQQIPDAHLGMPVGLEQGVAPLNLASNMFSAFPQDVQDAVNANSLPDIIWDDGSQQLWRLQDMMENVAANWDFLQNRVLDENVLANHIRVFAQAVQQANMPAMNSQMGNLDDNFMGGAMGGSMGGLDAANYEMLDFDAGIVKEEMGGGGNQGTGNGAGPSFN